jgi:hypothetical protein
MMYIITYGKDTWISMDTSIMATALENTIYFIAVSTALIWMNLKIFEIFADKFKWNRLARRDNEED